MICDLDESIAPLAATLFTQKDVDNVFMLSGGMRVLHKTFCEGGFFSGSLPDSILIPLPGEKTSPNKPYKLVEMALYSYEAPSYPPAKKL